jgi:hypothetical protein
MGLEYSEQERFEIIKRIDEIPIKIIQIIIIPTIQ